MFLKVWQISNPTIQKLRKNQIFLKIDLLMRIFDKYYSKHEDKKFILDLIDKTDFSQEGNIYFNEDKDEEMKPSIIKDETKNYLKIQDILLPKTEISEKRIEEKNEQDLVKKKIKIENNFFSRKKHK